MNFISSYRILVSSAILLGLGLGMAAILLLFTGSEPGRAQATRDVSVRHLIAGWKGEDGAERVSTIKLWLDESADRSRAEIYDQANTLQAIEIRDGRTFTRILIIDGSPVSAVVQTAAQSDDIFEGFERQLLRPHGIEPGRGATADANVTVDRIRGEVTIESTDGRVVLAFDPTSGRLEQIRGEAVTADGTRTDESLLTIDYDRDELTSVNSDLFDPDLPSNVPVQRITAFANDELASYAPFQVYGVGERLRSYELVSMREELSPALPDRRGTRLVQLEYRSPTGAEVTITNLPASFLVGTPRCSEPLVPTPVQPEADQVRLGNAACDLGDEVETDLGTGVLWFERPTIEIQIGDSVVLVHANTNDEALVFANNLIALN